MSTTNQRLKVLLHDAKLICLSKYQVLQTNVGDSDTELVAIKKEMDSCFIRFDNPAIWAQTIVFDEQDVTGFLLDIEGLGNADVDSFSSRIRSFITFLDEDVLKTALVESQNRTPSDFNRQVLDQLLQTQRKIQGRKTFFKNQGTDVDTHPDFIPLEQEQQVAIEAYREALKQNLVASTESDVRIFKIIGESIQMATELVKFFVAYMRFTNTMERKLPAAAEPKA